MYAYGVRFGQKLHETVRRVSLPLLRLPIRYLPSGTLPLLITDD